MEFIYKAKKSLNEMITGSLEAETLEQAVEQLSRQGITPILIEPKKESAAAAKPAKIIVPSGKWGLKKTVLFTQKLYNLVKARVELLAALRLLQQGSNDLLERQLLDDVIKNIKDGQSFSQSLSRYPQYFSPLYINIVHTGETTGQLKDSFEQLLTYLKRIEELQIKIKQALAYPIIMVLVGIATIFVMLSFILPKLVTMFEDFQAALPLPTRILLATSDVFKKYWFFIIMGGLVIFFIFQKYFENKGGIFGYLKYKLPLIKDLVYKQAVVNFSTSLSLLLKSGVNLLSALKTASPIIGNPVYFEQLEGVQKEVREGAPFSAALSRCKIFSDFFIQMIRVGEEGGRLDSVLADISESYEQEIDSDLKIIGSLLEPLIILVLGLIIGAMVIAVLLPIFNINALVGG